MSRMKELWSERWIAYPIACLFPRTKREEWLGDLHEVIFLMKERKYPRFFINLICISLTFVLLLSAIQINLKDLLEYSKKIN